MNIVENNKIILKIESLPSLWNWEDPPWERPERSCPPPPSTRRTRDNTALFSTLKKNSEKKFSFLFIEQIVIIVYVVTGHKYHNLRSHLVIFKLYLQWYMCNSCQTLQRCHTCHHCHMTGLPLVNFSYNRRPATTSGECVYGILHFEEIFISWLSVDSALGDEMTRGQNDQGTKWPVTKWPGMKCMRGRNDRDEMTGDEMKGDKV
jgi:hypothetical protein